MNIKKILGIILVILAVWYIGLPLLGFWAHLVYQVAKCVLTIAVAVAMIYFGKEIITKISNKSKEENLV